MPRSWRLMKDRWRMTSLQEHLNASCFFVFLLPWRLHCFTNFGLFVFRWQKLLTTAETTVTWTSRIWSSLTWRHNPFRNSDSLFVLTLLTSLHVAETGTSKLGLRELKCRNPFFFYLNTFLHILEIPLQNPCWPYRHLKNYRSHLSASASSEVGESSELSFPCPV